MPIRDQSLLAQWAVVTGSSSGIGRAIAMELAAAGANVVVHGHRHQQAAQEVANAIGELGVRSQVEIADLSQASEREQLIERAWQAGPIDIWINNAGADVLTGDAAERSFDQKLAALWAVDVQATVHLSREVGAKMKQCGKGTIVNLGWDQAATGMAGESGEMFGLVKGAIGALTLSLAKSLAPEVRVNCIAPGWIKTDWGKKASDYWQQRAIDESLLRRWGTPADVAKAVRFLISEEASFITGQILNVNGGRS